MDDPPATPPPPDRRLPEPPQPGLSGDPGLGRPSSAPVTGSTADRTPGWLVLAGGILVLVGVFLPWFSYDVGGVSRSTSGTGEWGLMLLGALATARGLSMVQPGRFRFALGTPLIGGAILAILVWTRWSDLHEALDRATRAGLTASIGIGFWMVVTGTACVLIGGVLAMARRRA
jgi:hypothetical protein